MRCSLSAWIPCRVSHAGTAIDLLEAADLKMGLISQEPLWGRHLQPYTKTPKARCTRCLLRRGDPQSTPTVGEHRQRLLTLRLSPSRHG
jgi:hypothetical protein